MRALPWTDSMRGVGCVLVIVWHVIHTVIYQFEESFPGAELSTGLGLTIPLGIVAREAVLMFVVLSGYLLGRHWRRTRPMAAETRGYMVRRSWRLLPPFYAALLLTIAGMLFLGLREPSGTPWDVGLPLDWGRVVASFLLVTDLGGAVPLSHQLWTIPVEYHLYLLGPLLVVLSLRMRGVMAVAVALFCLFVIPFPAPYFPIAFVAAFWAGLARQDVKDEVFRFRAWLPLLSFITVAGLALAALAFTLAFPLDRTTESIRNYILADALTTPVLLWWVVRSDIRNRVTPLIRVLVWKPFIWAGHRSFSIYLTHALVVELAWRWWFDGTTAWGGPFALYLLVAVVGSLALGDAFYRTVALPSARKAARSGRAKIPAPPPPQAKERE